MKKRLFTSFLFITLISIGIYGQILTGRDWKLTYLRGVSLGQATAFISIDQGGKRFHGNTSCNIMNGTVDMRRNSIRFGAVITTKRACTISTGNVEGGFLTSLGRVDRYQLSQYRLRLYERNRLLMEFEPLPKPEVDEELKPVADQLNLEDKKWILQSIANSPIPKVEEEAFIVFDQVKGSAGGNTSCNVFGGNYETNGDKISVTQTIATMRACIEDERMNIERQFLDGLRTANRYEVRGDKLLLYHDRKLLLTFIGRDKK
jgi:heat shock protein HslJ